MGRADYLALGDWNVVCFQCGFKRKASTMERNWQGYYVCPEHNEPRQPQDFARGVPDDQIPPWVQPDPAVIYTYTNTFLGISDGITLEYQLGSGLYVVTITGVFANDIPIDYSTNGIGGIMLTEPAPVGQFITASGTEIVGQTITINQAPDGSYTIPPIQLVPVSPPPPPPPPPPPSGNSLSVEGTLSDNTTFAITVPAGQRVPIISGSLRGSVMHYADGAVCIENCYAGTTGDLQGNFIITNNGSQIFEGYLTIWAYARTRPFWLNLPAVNASADLSFFPKLGAAPAASMYTEYLTKDNSPMGIGLANKAMGTTGERADLGPLPQWDSCYLTNPSTNNALVVRGMSDASAVWPIHVIDPATNKMLDVTQFPKASMLPSAFKIGNPIVGYTTSTPLSVDQAQAHSTQYCALASAIYGTDYDKEELSLRTNYIDSLWQNPQYRLSSGYTESIHCQTRGIGRGLVLLMYATKYSDNTAYFQAMVPSVATDLNQFLTQTGIHVTQFDTPHPNNGFGVQRLYLMIYGIGVALDYGYTAFQQSFDYFCVEVKNAILNARHELATIYSISIRDASGTLATDYGNALVITEAFQSNIAGAMQYPENSVNLQSALYGLALGQLPDNVIAGDFSGYPTSPTGFAAIMQPAISQYARHGTDQVNAQATLTKYNTYARQDYSQNPKYNVLP